MFTITLEKDGMQFKNKELTWKQGRPLISSSVTKRNLKVIENRLSLSCRNNRICFLLEGRTTEK